MRGSKANLVIRQGAEQSFKPTLYVENISGTSETDFEKTLRAAVEKIASTYPGINVKNSGKAWVVVVPDKHNVGHEAHFAQVTEKYLQYLAAGALPEWEEPNMI